MKHPMDMKPDHPHTDQIARIVKALDDALDSAKNQDEADRIFHAAHEGVDGDALAWVSIQRAFRAHKVTTVGEARKVQHEVTMTAAIWLEGFVAGRKFTQEGG